MENEVGLELVCEGAVLARVRVKREKAQEALDSLNSEMRETGLTGCWEIRENILDVVVQKLQEVLELCKTHNIPMIGAVLVPNNAGPTAQMAVVSCRPDKRWPRLFESVLRLVDPVPGCGPDESIGEYSHVVIDPSKN